MEILAYLLLKDSAQTVTVSMAQCALLHRVLNVLLVQLCSQEHVLELKHPPARVEQNLMAQFVLE